MVFNVNANSLESNVFSNDTKNYEALKLVPSAVMRTTSKDFSIEADVTKPLGLYQLYAKVNDDDSSILDIDKLEGFLTSNVGKHYIKFEETLSMDLSELDDDKDYNIAVEIEYTDADLTNGTYPYTVLRFNIEETSRDIDGLILYSFHFNDDAITDLTQIERTQTFATSNNNYTSNNDYIAINEDVIEDDLTLGANYFADTSDNGIDIELKSNPNIGDFFKVTDIKGTFENNNVSLKKNGKKIMGKDDDYQLDVDNREYKIIYVGNDDWRVI